MGDRSRVVWSEGMFLRPQHFQQGERHREHSQHQRGLASEGHFWGFHTLQLDCDHPSCLSPVSLKRLNDFNIVRNRLAVIVDFFFQCSYHLGVARNRINDLRNVCGDGIGECGQISLASLFDAIA